MDVIRTVAAADARAIRAASCRDGPALDADVTVAAHVGAVAEANAGALGAAACRDAATRNEDAALQVGSLATADARGMPAARGIDVAALDGDVVHVATIASADVVARADAGRVLASDGRDVAAADDDVVALAVAAGPDARGAVGTVGIDIGIALDDEIAVVGAVVEEVAVVVVVGADGGRTVLLATTIGAQRARARDGHMARPLGADGRVSVVFAGEKAVVVAAREVDLGARVVLADVDGHPAAILDDDGRVLGGVVVVSAVEVHREATHEIDGDGVVLRTARDDEVVLVGRAAHVIEGARRVAGVAATADVYPALPRTRDGGNAEQRSRQYRKREECAACGVNMGFEHRCPSPASRLRRV